MRNAVRELLSVDGQASKGAFLGTNVLHERGHAKEGSLSRTLGDSAHRVSVLGQSQEDFAKEPVGNRRNSQRAKIHKHETAKCSFTDMTRTTLISSQESGKILVSSME